MSVNGRRGSPRSGMVALTGGSARLHQLLIDQLRRRRRRALPEPITQAGWCLDVKGFDPRPSASRRRISPWPTATWG